jgi:hypothetical protein
MSLINRPIKLYPASSHNVSEFKSMKKEACILVYLSNLNSGLFPYGLRNSIKISHL